MHTSDDDIIQAFRKQLYQKEYPCIAAHHAALKNQVFCMVAMHMGCPADDQRILDFLYGFIDTLHKAEDEFNSAVVLFRQPVTLSEDEFEQYFWRRLQSLADVDAKQYNYDQRVSADITSPQFSFSLKEEAFYIIGLHPSNARPARRFEYPAMVFNAHAQFEKLRQQGHYTRMQQVVRKRDLQYSGSVNPMLADFGEISEIYQYTGKQYDQQWQCPLVIPHASAKNNSSS